MDKGASAARMAEAAWERVVEVRAAEALRRSDASASHPDPAVDRWLQRSKR
jgi:hypothetical protein